MHNSQKKKRPQTMEDKRRDSSGTPPPQASMVEAPPSDHQTSRRRGGGNKRKLANINSVGSSSTPQMTSSKRQAREKPPALTFPPIPMNGPCTRARVQPFNSNSLSELAVVKSEAELREAAAKAEEMSRASENLEALEAKIEAEYEAIRSRGDNVHVVPIHAGWFSWTKIHPLEERMLPSFFNGKSETKTPETYMEIRNWIVKKFHHNPNSQVELKHLSDMAVGELDARQEVMEFLDYWGLINYHPFPRNDHAAMAVDADANNDESGKTISLVENLFKFETVESPTPVVPRMNMAMPAASSGLFPESVVADELVKSEGPSVEYHCNSCSADCSRKRYHCQKQADFDLCADCFNNGKFGSDMSSSDFILMEPAENGGVSGRNWTDQETLLLLEAIELFRDNWSEIAEHVATKTKAECILHFVQMPIEDAFFNHDDEENAAPKENGLPVSIGAEDSAFVADQGRDVIPKNVPEKAESQDGTTANQASSYPPEKSEPDEVNELDKRLEAKENFALKALKEAFVIVGTSPSPGQRMSFAEAGNPVMTLAAFLVRLVEPNIAAASVTSILKSLSGNYSSEQLAGRHCFRLVDPPDDKNLADPERAATETVEHEAPKDVEKQNEETPDAAVNEINLSDDKKVQNKDSAPKEGEEKDSAFKDRKPVASPSEFSDRSDIMKEIDAIAPHEEAQPTSMSELSYSDMPKHQIQKDAEELAVSESNLVKESNTELPSNLVKESEDRASAMDSGFQESQKVEDMISASEKQEADLLAISHSMTGQEENTGDRGAKKCDSQTEQPPTTKNDFEVNKLTQAAVTALSAAAVKAKFLADQEEDQILHLSKILVEKQLYKLETKLAFFNDMESVVMRVKEQLDRSKQRLFHERAQIIATRFGKSGSVRPNLPPNAAAVSFPNSASRTFMNMNSLRPPISRPTMTPNPTSSTYMTAGATGSSVQPHANKLSSFGMK